MVNKYGPLVLFLFFAGSFILKSTFYVVPEGRQVIVTQFGKPIGQPITEAGLKLKIPFLQDVRPLEKRMLNWDGRPTEMTTRDKKTITVDTTARWRIKDPLLFIKSVQNERNALSRIDDILEGETREVVSNHNLVEAVRNSNAILESKIDPNSEEMSGEILKISEGREKLSKIISTNAAVGLKTFGIELIDVQLRRIAYEETAEAAVYKRMISERVRIAEKLRSEGTGEASSLVGRRKKNSKKFNLKPIKQFKKLKVRLMPKQ